MQVLVVEDDDGIGESLVELLELEGYEVRWARDGVDGLALMHERRPDLILLDLLMPRMDGFQFRTVQKSEPEYRDVPVIILSAHARADEVDAADFVQKPFDIPALLSTVERHCAAP
jgi:CheY-like chemotaxis protein